MMYLWESDIQESVVFKPIEIRGKKGRKKMKKANAAIYIPNMDADNFEKICNEKDLQFVYVEVPPHGRLIDADEITEHKYIAIPSYRKECTDGKPKSDEEVIAFKVGWNCAIDAMAENAPTILPADKEGEG